MRYELKDIDSLCSAINAEGPGRAGWALTDRVSPQTLRALRSSERRRQCYKDFEIPKKSGGVRTITAPTGLLKEIQSCLAGVLSGIYEPEPYVMGFVQGRSVLANAERHLNRNYVLNLDLSDFFPSITARAVEKALTMQGVDAHTSSLISTICTYPAERDGQTIDVLPQGAPTSPVLSNMVCRMMDRRLKGLADRFHLTYTRYADDMTFSSNHNVYHEDGEFFRELRSIICDNGFTINETKTRLLRNGMRQEVTGLTVGERVNVSRRWLKNLRTAIFQMERSRPCFRELQQVTGRLNYLGMVKGKDDPTFLKLKRRLQRVAAIYRARIRRGMSDETVSACLGYSYEPSYPEPDTIDWTTEEDDGKDASTTVNEDGGGDMMTPEDLASEISRMLGLEEPVGRSIPDASLAAVDEETQDDGKDAPVEREETVVRKPARSAIRLSELDGDAFTAAKKVIALQKASVAMLQLELMWGYRKASKALERLEAAGIITRRNNGMFIVNVKSLDDL